MPRRQSFLSGAAILAGAVAVTKVLGALYKIPLGNLLDSQGMAHFYAAYNVYNLLLMLSTAGLPLAASRLVAQAEALGRHSQARRVFRCALALLGVVGLVFSALMFLLPQTMAGALHDPMAAAAIRVLAPSVLCVCLTSAIRGYTQGLGNMTPTAVSQIIESACKLAVGLGLCAFLLRRGAAPETGAAGAIAGVTCGTALGLLFLLWALRRCPRESGGPLEPVGDTLGQLLRIGVPITVAGGAMSLMTLLDQSLVLGTLQARLGLSAEAAAELYGQYTFGMTLFVLPPSFIYPLTVSLIPAISQARTRHDDAAAARLTASALRITALLALPMGVGLSVLAGPILQLLYPAVPETAQAAAYHLTVLGIGQHLRVPDGATNGFTGHRAGRMSPSGRCWQGGRAEDRHQLPDGGQSGHGHSRRAGRHAVQLRPDRGAEHDRRPPLHPWAGGLLPLPVASGPVYGDDGAWRPARRSRCWAAMFPRIWQSPPPLPPQQRSTR